MPKMHVICTLPHASHLINNVVFKDHDSGGVITADPVEPHVAALFKGIQGYTIVDAKDEKPASDQKPAKEPASVKPPKTPDADKPKEGENAEVAGGRRGGRKPAKAQDGEKPADGAKAAVGEGEGSQDGAQGGDAGNGSQAADETKPTEGEAGAGDK